MKWNGMDWNGMEWIGLDWIGMKWNGLDWNGMDWIGLDWNGLDWNLVVEKGGVAFLMSQCDPNTEIGQSVELLICAGRCCRLIKDQEKERQSERMRKKEEGKKDGKEQTLDRRERFSLWIFDELFDDMVGFVQSKREISIKRRDEERRRKKKMQTVDGETKGLELAKDVV